MFTLSSRGEIVQNVIEKSLIEFIRQAFFVGKGRGVGRLISYTKAFESLLFIVGLHCMKRVAPRRLFQMNLNAHLIALLDEHPMSCLYIQT